MEAGTVSVIIPTYNRSTWVKEAVASAVSQEGTPMEVIVVDDGSTDDTASALEPFASAIRCIPQAHLGVSAARNTGILAARGEWIAFLDSDDVWLPGKLAVQLDYLKLHPEIRICQCEELWIRNSARLNPKKYHKKPSGYCFPLLLERCLISPSAAVVHRRLLDEVGLFDESLPACEDYDMWLRIGYRYPIGLVAKPLLIKRGGHSDQLSATTPTLDLYRIRALAKLLRREPLDSEQRRLAFAMLARKCSIYTAGCRKRHRVEEATEVEELLRNVAAELGLSES